MSRFPLFIDLAGRRAVVVGGGAVGLRRAAVLARFGAQVTVISPALSGPLPEGTYLPRPYQAGDLAGAFLAVAAAGDSAVNTAVEEEARRLGVLFNRADDRRRCDFFFPAVCTTDELSAGVVGRGADHARTAKAARAIRAALEGLE